MTSNGLSQLTMVDWKRSDDGRRRMEWLQLHGRKKALEQALKRGEETSFEEFSD